METSGPFFLDLLYDVGMKRPNCTPPNTPRIQNVPVCRPGAPFGGPASGLWPSGSGPAADQPVPAQVITPPPGPTCTTPDIFADCFGSCSGTLPADGTVCGWTYTNAFGAFGGTVTLSPGQMLLNSAAATQFPAAVKTSPQPVTPLDMSFQAKFTESATIPLGSGANYSFYLVDQTGANAFLVFLDDLGSAAVHVGAVAGAIYRTGTWTPNNGEHTVHVTVVAGVPTLYIDGVAIVLVPAGSLAVGIGTLGNNTVSAFFTANVAGSHSEKVSEIFITSGILLPTTDFCCPV